MKLKNGIIRPGIVIEVLENNQIRAGAPGLFNREDKEKLPIIMPFPCFSHSNQYSQIHELDDVWIVNFSDNPLQLYWFRKDNVSDNKSILESGENVEILCNKESGSGWASIYFTDGSGWIIKNGFAIIQIRADGSILLDTGSPHRAIDINSNGISLGTAGSSEHPAAYGDVIQQLFQKIQITLNLVKQAANTSPYTKAIATAIGSTPTEMDKIIPNLVSPNVSLD